MILFLDKVVNDILNHNYNQDDTQKDSNQAKHKPGEY